MTFSQGLSGNKVFPVPIGFTCLLQAATLAVVNFLTVVTA